MNKKLYIVFSFLLFFLSTHATTQACVDIIDSIFSNTKSMSGTYTKELKLPNKNYTTKVFFYEDFENNRKKYLIKDSENQTEIFILKDTVFIILPSEKRIFYYTGNDSLNFASKFFNINLFDILKVVVTYSQRGSVETKNVKGVSYLKYEDRDNPLMPTLLLKLNKDNLPEIVEIYDKNNSIVLQTFLKSYKENLPRSIKTLTNLYGNVVEENVTVKVLKLNEILKDTIFYFERKGYKLEEFEKYLKDAGITQW
ncbi:MAG: hypothetical protein XD76_0875 [candidate division TA06 bacterium 32_111]|uniref:Outer membrane lipoprotein-sorting protein n=2 Tax=Bacteria candidate phyla TaxID=1783234 RepID=A0A101I126_UNCT6|nr:MAG: hypothetical protein XD76_0875 [candidate division TA06 bacterium 32_111]KUK86263.1 MAG: hypothetical protein XE03_1634 [candidate division TA06 bacterium 34_109]HAF08397.1 hypothetical protein [candidate division WOR-3 bacterium]HCP15945.1 hypothetical protein [candidate division WOR-3 bacterium]